MDQRLSTVQIEQVVTTHVRAPFDIDKNRYCEINNNFIYRLVIHKSRRKLKTKGRIQIKNIYKV